jgi:hypothetical protein
VIAQVSFTAADPGVFDAASNYLFKPLDTPLSLAVGQYTIVAYGFSSANPAHNSSYDGLRPAFGGGGIQFVQSVWGTPPGVDLPPTFPTQTWGAGAPDLFDGPNMIYYVPTPGAVLLSALGMALVGHLRKRRVL